MADAQSTLYSYTRSSTNELVKKDKNTEKQSVITIPGNLSLTDTLLYLISLNVTDKDVAKAIEEPNSPWYRNIKLYKDLKSNKLWGKLQKGINVQYRESGRNRTRLRLLKENGFREDEISLDLPSAAFYNQINIKRVTRSLNQTFSKNSTISENEREDVSTIVISPNRNGESTKEKNDKISTAHNGANGFQIIAKKIPNQFKKSISSTTNSNKEFDISENQINGWQARDRVLYEIFVQRNRINKEKPIFYDMPCAKQTIFKNYFRNTNFGKNNVSKGNWVEWENNVELQVYSLLSNSVGNAIVQSFFTLCYAYGTNGIYIQNLQKEYLYWMVRVTSSNKVICFLENDDQFPIFQNFESSELLGILPSYGLQSINDLVFPQKRNKLSFIYHRKLFTKNIYQDTFSLDQKGLPLEYVGLVIEPIVGNNNDDAKLGNFTFSSTYQFLTDRNLASSIDASKKIQPWKTKEKEQNWLRNQPIFERKDNVIANIHTEKNRFENQLEKFKDKRLSFFWAHVAKRIFRSNVGENLFWVGFYGISNILSEGLSTTCIVQFDISRILKGRIYLYPVHVCFINSSPHNCQDYALPKIIFKIDILGKKVKEVVSNDIWDRGCYTSECKEKLINFFWSKEKELMQLMHRVEHILDEQIVHLKLNLNEIEELSKIRYCDVDHNDKILCHLYSKSILMIKRCIIATIPFKIHYSEEYPESLVIYYSDVITQDAMSYAMRYGITPCVPANLRKTKYDNKHVRNREFFDDTTAGMIVCVKICDEFKIVNNHVILPCGEIYDPDQCGISLHQCAKELWWKDDNESDIEIDKCRMNNFQCECGKITISQHLIISPCQHYENVEDENLVEDLLVVPNSPRDEEFDDLDFLFSR
ncbi:MAG: P5 [Corattcep virus 2]|nr:MAG: P5 [Corattcep virus 2]